MKHIYPLQAIIDIFGKELKDKNFAQKPA